MPRCRVLPSSLIVALNSYLCGYTPLNPVCGLRKAVGSALTGRCRSEVREAIVCAIVVGLFDPERLTSHLARRLVVIQQAAEPLRSERHQLASTTSMVRAFIRSAQRCASFFAISDLLSILIICGPRPFR